MILYARIIISNPQIIASNIYLICFNDISNVINVPKKDQITFYLINLQRSCFLIVAHAHTCTCKIAMIVV